MTESFKREVEERIAENGGNRDLQATAAEFMKASLAAQYSYNYSWLGRPIIQYPQDIVAMQELIWAVQPELIIETGIAHGGSLILSASMLELNAACGGSSDAEVLGIDIDIRAHNRKAIEAHPLSTRITMLQGSSIAPEVVEVARQKAAGKHSVMVVLDSNHTHDHVLAELEAYALLTTRNSYCIVFDTVIEEMPAEMFGDRPWCPGNNPKSALREYLRDHPEFQIDESIDHKLLISAAGGGYLRRVR